MTYKSVVHTDLVHARKHGGVGQVCQQAGPTRVHHVVDVRFAKIPLSFSKHLRKPARLRLLVRVRQRLQFRRIPLLGQLQKQFTRADAVVALAADHRAVAQHGIAARAELASKGVDLGGVSPDRFDIGLADNDNTGWAG